MSIQDIVELKFDETINAIFATKQNVIDFLMAHERKKLCIENLVVEIRKMQLERAKNLKKHHVELLAGEFAVMFSKNALLKKEQDAMHYLEKQRLADEHKQVKEIMEMFDSEDSSERL